MQSFQDKSYRHSFPALQAEWRQKMIDNSDASAQFSNADGTVSRP
jgi:hypothetical protein